MVSPATAHFGKERQPGTKVDAQGLMVELTHGRIEYYILTVYHLTHRETNLWERDGRIVVERGRQLG